MKKNKKGLFLLVFVLCLLFTWIVQIFHIGVFLPPQIPEPSGKANVLWIPKEKLGIHQIVLEGNPYERGVNFGEKTKDLLYRQEKVLVNQFDRFFGNIFLRNLFILGTIRWFWGIDAYFEDWMLQEMYGVAQSASHEFDYLADRFTRQVAYHGLHEVGQLMIDRGEQTPFGCTVFSIPVKNSWVIGRNFDFEAGRIFDEEKILKWVFPLTGYPFVSVIWAGMVGAVTGVNEKGIFISINAAGSDDFRRYGTPSTLVLLKALQFSSTAEEAIEIIRRETMFITDIFVLGDSRNGLFYRIEKSPKKIAVTEITEPSVVTNHLEDKVWTDDKANRKRQESLTTLARYGRGKNLFSKIPSQAKEDPAAATKILLKFLRDKKDKNGELLHLGNRKAIDALISTHSVIYDGVRSILYVSQGPALVGPFIGFDLKKSFSSRRPAVSEQLSEDEAVSQKEFLKLKEALALISDTEAFLKERECEKAKRALDKVESPEQRHYRYFNALGDYFSCKNLQGEAKKAWKKSMALSPPYGYEREKLKEKIE